MVSCSVPSKAILMEAEGLVSLLVAPLVAPLVVPRALRMNDSYVFSVMICRKC